MKRVGACHLVLAPSVVLMYVRDLTVLRVVFQSVSDVLEPGGLFVFDLWKWFPARAGSLLTKGDLAPDVAELTRAMTWVPAGNTLLFRERFVVDDVRGRQVVFDEHRLSLFNLEELSAALSDRGFEVEVRNGFTQESFAFAEQKPVFLFRRRKPALIGRRGGNRSGCKPHGDHPAEGSSHPSLSVSSPRQRGGGQRA